MKLLVISNLYPPEVQGGYEILCAQVVEGLRAIGHSVMVLTSGSEDGSADPTVWRRLELTGRFPEPVRPSRWDCLAIHQRNALTTRRAIEDLRPDRIFIWSQLRLTLGCAEAAEESRLPVSYTFNDEHPTGFLPRAANGTVRSHVGAAIDAVFPRPTARARRFAHTTCISASLKADLVAKGMQIPGCRVIYQGIPIERFPPLLDRPRGPEFRILYAGQLHEYKGVHTLLEAAALLSRRGSRRFEVSIAGEGPSAYKARLSELARVVGAPVRFLGRVPHEKIPTLYQTHDVFVFPSIWREPFGLTHLEAMASGTPVVSTTEGGPGESLEDERNALTFPKADPARLADALARLASDEDLARRIARNARAMVETRFTLDRYVRDLEAFLGEAPQ